MKALASNAQFFLVTQKVGGILRDPDLEKAENVQIDDHAGSTPARGVLLGVAGGIALWGMIIWAATRLF